MKWERKRKRKRLSRRRWGLDRKGEGEGVRENESGEVYHGNAHGAAKREKVQEVQV